MADSRSTTPLSSLFKDPDVRAAFWRAERDQGRAFAITTVPPKVLSGGAAEPVPCTEKSLCG